MATLTSLASATGAKYHRTSQCCNMAQILQIVFSSWKAEARTRDEAGQIPERFL